MGFIWERKVFLTSNLAIQTTIPVQKKSCLKTTPRKKQVDDLKKPIEI